MYEDFAEYDDGEIEVPDFVASNLAGVPPSLRCSEAPVGLSRLTANCHSALARTPHRLPPLVRLAAREVPVAYFADTTPPPHPPRRRLSFTRG